MEAFSGRSWITVIKKTQTALESQPNMRAGQSPDRQAESEGMKDQKLNALYQLFSVSFLPDFFLSGVRLGQALLKRCLIFFLSLHTVEIWLLLLIRFSAALAKLIWSLDTLFRRPIIQTNGDWTTRYGGSLDILYTVSTPGSASLCTRTCSHITHRHKQGRRSDTINWKLEKSFNPAVPFCYFLYVDMSPALNVLFFPSIYSLIKFLWCR